MERHRRRDNWRFSWGWILGALQPSLAVQSTLSMWGEKMRPHWPTSASLAGGVAGVAQRSIFKLGGVELLNARLVRFSAWRSIVVSVSFFAFSHRRGFMLSVLELLACHSAWRICCRRRALYLRVLCTLQLTHRCHKWLPAWQSGAGVSGFSAHGRPDRLQTKGLGPLVHRLPFRSSAIDSRLS